VGSKQRDDSNLGVRLTARFGSRGAGHLFCYHDGNSWNESGVWCHAAGWVVPRTCKRRAEWRVGGPRARESPTTVAAWPPCVGRFGLGVSAYRQVVGRGAAALRRWVLHGGGPLRCGGAVSLVLTGGGSL
jgi:hypothetical protein